MKRWGVSGVCKFPLARCVRLGIGLALAGCLLLTGARPIRAQGGDITLTVEEVDKSAFPTVRVRVGVRDQNGVPVPDLATEHFEIIEDGTQRHTPASVTAEETPEAQVSLAIVIDLYSTMEGAPIETAQEATRDLLSELLDQPDDQDRAAFVGVHPDLSTDPTEIDDEYEVSFTNDRNRLLNVINFLHERLVTAGPGTPLYDAVIKAIRMAEETQPMGHRALIVMTDGQDRGSVNEDSDTIQRASEAHTPVFTVGLSNSSLDEQYLQRLADNTGGTYQPAEASDDVSPMFSNVLTTLRTQYVLSYESGLPEDGQSHNVLVRVRTSTQTEGVQEYRMETPGGLTDETEEPPPTSEPADPTSTPEPRSGNDDGDNNDDDDGWIGELRDWIQDNTLLAILIVAAIGLLFVALVIAIILVNRRREGAAEGGMPPEVPYPPAPPEGFQPGLDEVGTWGGRETDVEGADMMPPQETIAEGTPPPGATPSEVPEAPPAPSPFPPQPFQPSSADRTRILRREPTMGVVGLLIERDHPEHRLDVAKPMVTVGRSQENDLVIDHNTVSRQHAAIKLEEGQFHLYDLGSTNGTFVGDDRVREPVPLEDGVTVRFGEKAFIFKMVSLEV